jgi:carbon-monoxide dehydrogenase medium subunit
MYEFDYHQPASVADAVALRAGSADGTYLAGGMTLIPTLKQRLASPSDLIDLAAVAGLGGIEVGSGRVVVGAMTRHAEVAASAAVKQAIPALAYLAGQIGDPQVRNRGTLGGSVANSDPSADYPAAVIALGATIETDRRRIAADDYFQDLFQTALEPGELIRSIAFPVPRRAAYRKFPNPASRYAVVGVFVAQFDAGVRVGVTGAGPCAYRATTIEQALARRLTPEAVDEAAIDHDRFNSDLHASAEYRGNLVRVMARRAVEDLLASG